jgi:hypothetical protein
MRYYKTSKLVEGQSKDYAAIRAAKKDPSLYPLDVCTPLKIGCAPPRDIEATKDVVYRYITSVDNLQERRVFVIKHFVIYIAIATKLMQSLLPSEDFVLVINTMYPMAKNIGKTSWWI